MRSMVTDLLRGIFVDPFRLCCYQNTCVDGEHHNTIDPLHRALVTCRMGAGETAFDRCRKRWRQIRGWNKLVQEAHSAAMKSFLERTAKGGPRWRPLADEIGCALARFTLCLWRNRANGKELRTQSLGDKLAGSDITGLWRGLCAMNSGTNSPTG